VGSVLQIAFAVGHVLALLQGIPLT